MIINKHKAIHNFMVFKVLSALALSLLLWACHPKPILTTATNQSSSRYIGDTILMDTLMLKTFPELVAILQPYEKSPSPEDQRKVYWQYYFSGIHSSNVADRKAAIKKLLCACGDSLNTAYACQSAMEYLQNAQKSDFDSVDRARVQQLMEKGNNAYFPQPAEYYPYDDLVLLAGYLDLTSSIPLLQKLVAPESNYQRKWEAQLALARLGDAHAIKYCMLQFNSKPLDIRELKEAFYICQPEVVALYNTYLFSDEQIATQSDVVNSYVNKSNWIMPYLSQAIIGFPIPCQNSNAVNPQEDVKTARQWINDNAGKYQMNRNLFTCIIGNCPPN